MKHNQKCSLSIFFSGDKWCFNAVFMSKCRLWPANEELCFVTPSSLAGLHVLHEIMRDSHWLWERLHLFIAGWCCSQRIKHLFSHLVLNNTHKKDTDYLKRSAMTQTTKLTRTVHLYTKGNNYSVCFLFCVTAPKCQRLEELWRICKMCGWRLLTFKPLKAADCELQINYPTPAPLLKLNSCNEC